MKYFRSSLLVLPLLLFSTVNGVVADWAGDKGFSSKEITILEDLFNQEQYEEFLERYSIDDEYVQELLDDEDTSGIFEYLAETGRSKSQIDIFFDNLEKEVKISKLIDEKDTIQNILEVINKELDKTNTSTSSIPATTHNIASTDQKNYSYLAANGKSYLITYLPDQEAYTSPNFEEEMYFIATPYIERYIDSKNPGSVVIRSNYNTTRKFDNASELRYIAPNGKIYYTDIEDNKRYSPQMKNKTIRYTNLKTLQSTISSGNPMLPIRSHSTIESTEPYQIQIKYYKDFTLYKTDKGWMSYSTAVGKYFSTADELKAYLSNNAR
ncbi:MAG: hypothetical protein PHU61_03435 [Candidatus Absconditabacteria bacterium]|nr:hypothetical protein [Candidatus Absconditabacteria bacterium]MDD3868317.1 hypothetical protein [Candidatus Absconditabacteria bacterium]MDD4713993.1 hypothetical protein [Candidatus Absconditabacteria bacterium]